MRHPEVGRVGRFLRFLLGALLLGVTIPFLAEADATRIGWVVSIVLLSIAFYTIIHFGVYRFLPDIHPLLGAALALLPAAVVFVVVPWGDVAVGIFIGISLLVASVRADAGCEVLSIPGLLFGRRTHLACILFTPIDWMESKLSGQ